MPETPLRPVLRRAALAVYLALAGCVDSLGVGSDCTAEMSEIRRDEGRSPAETRRSSQPDGSTVEHWTYFAPNRTYTFRWGGSHADCQVTPGSFTRVPGDLPQF